MKNICYLFTVCLFFACSDDDPTIPNDPEVITNVNLVLTSDTGDIAKFSFEDLDGENGNDPVISSTNLQANTSYTGSLEFLSIADGVTEDITQEIKEEDEDHQVFYNSTISQLQISYTDQDADGNPIGLESIFATGNAAQGTITIILRHKPDKFATGVSDGNIAMANGSTDVEVVFPITIQ